MPVIDTSWLYALLAPADAHHADAMQQAATADRLIVPAIIFTEWIQLASIRLRRTRSRREAHEEVLAIARQFLETPSVHVVERPSIHQALDAMARHAAHLSFPDAAAVIAARMLDEPILTFDQDQAAAL